MVHHRVFDGPYENVDYDETMELSFTGRSVAVSVDGACRRNGYADAEGGYGVFFGPGSRYNRAGRLPSDETHTNQKAEIYAAQEAVDAVLEIVGLNYDIVIITDSHYLFKSMSDLIYTWVCNGFKNSKRKPVVNGEQFEKLHRTIVDIECEGTRVRFWWVPRSFNTDADDLAKSVLDGY